MEDTVFSVRSKARKHHPSKTYHLTVFVENGQRAVCIILSHEGVAISTERLDCSTANEAITQLRRWIKPMNLDKEGLASLIESVRGDFALLQNYRRYGYDPTQTYLGPPELRRLPEVDEVTIH